MTKFTSAKINVFKVFVSWQISLKFPAKFCRDFDVICLMFSPINIALTAFLSLRNSKTEF